MSLDTTHVDDVEVVNEFTPNEARQHTTKINSAVGVAGLLVIEAWERRIWTTLDYKSWPDYCDAELAVSEQNPTSRAALMVGLRKAGASYRAIAIATGQSVGKVHKDISGVHAVNTSNDAVRQNAAPVTGLDGKQYEPTQPERPAEDQAGEAEDREDSVDSGEDRSPHVDTTSPAPPALDELLPEETSAIEDASFQRELSKAISTVRRSILTFDAATVADRADADNWEQLNLLLGSLGDWFHTAKDARPNGLRVINGGQQ